MLADIEKYLAVATFYESYLFMLRKVDHVHERGSWNMKKTIIHWLAMKGLRGKLFFRYTMKRDAKNEKNFYKCQLVLKMTLEKEHFGINYAKKLVSCNEIRTQQCNNISELFYYKNLWDTKCPILRAKLAWRRTFVRVYTLTDGMDARHVVFLVLTLKLPFWAEVLV